MLPGVISMFSSISSRPSTSTGTAWSSMRRPVRVLATTVAWSCSAAFAIKTRRTARSPPATTSTRAVAGSYPSLVAITENLPRRQRQSGDAGRVGRGGLTADRNGCARDRSALRDNLDADRSGSRLCRVRRGVDKAEAEGQTTAEKGSKNGTHSAVDHTRTRTAMSLRSPRGSSTCEATGDSGF